MAKKAHIQIPIPVLVTIGFLLPIALGFLAQYLVRDVFHIPTQQEACVTHCATRHMQGVLVSAYTRIQTNGRPSSIMNCECR